MPNVTGARRLLILIAAIALVVLGSAGAASPAAAESGPAASAAKSTADGVKRLRARARAACARAERLSRGGRKARAAKARKLCRAKRAHARRALAATTSTSRTAAPVLRVSGTTLLWGRVADVDRYVLATKVPGKTTAYKVVYGTSYTPPAVPGATVKYGLRTDVAGSLWAAEVSITYPSTAPAPTPTPSPSPAPSTGFQPGIVSGSDLLNEANLAGKLGAKLVRVEFDINTSAANMRTVIAAHAANGTRVMPLAGFHARMPTVTEARNVATWAREFGPGGTFWATRSDGHLAIRAIEFGNETSYGYQYGDSYSAATYIARARDYALRFKDAHEAIRAANAQVGLLAQAEDGGSGSSNWVDNMFAAVPDLGSRVAGWTVHPYGPRIRWEAKIDRLIKHTAARGASSSIPLWITEWGIATDNGRCLSDNYGWSTCMTYSTAATSLRQSVSEMRTKYGSRLGAFFLYAARDQRATGSSTSREHYFGATRSDGTDKGAYSTEVRAFLKLTG